MRVKVIFRKFPNGDIIAFFPEFPGSNDAGTCFNYTHTGKHGSGQATCKGTKRATSDEYCSLYFELYRFGYEMTVVSRFTGQMYHKRVKRLQEAAK